ncbi:hypothetical protein BX600DRAFT_448354, partial [Xylariales sp. PMI_506]
MTYVQSSSRCIPTNAVSLLMQVASMAMIISAWLWAACVSPRPGYPPSLHGQEGGGWEQRSRILLSSLQGSHFHPRTKKREGRAGHGRDFFGGFSFDLEHLLAYIHTYNRSHYTHITYTLSFFFFFFSSFSPTSPSVSVVKT